MIDVDMHHSFGDASISAQFKSDGGVTALFGRSGAGKTTVINAIAGLLRPDQARIVVKDRVLVDTAQGVFVPPHQRRIGYVFQDARLFPHLTVRKNLLYGARFTERRVSMDPVVELLDLKPFLERGTEALSGGERQRVAIGRALLSAPDMLLMDEPLAALDQGRKHEILPYLMRLRDEAAVPIVYVSHAISEVAQLANTLVVLDNGAIAATGPIDQLLSDPDLVPHLGVRDAGSIVTGRVVAHHADGLTELQTSGGALFLPHRTEPLGAVLRVRIEAQDVILSLNRPIGFSALNVLKGEISAIRDGAGPGVIVQIDLGDERVLARVTKRSALNLQLEIRQNVYAMVKTVAVGRSDIGAVGNT